MATTFSEEDIRRKIESLLKLSEGALTEEEAASAAAKAAELCLKYNIDKATVNGKIRAEQLQYEIVHIVIYQEAITPKFYFYLLDSVKILFDTFTYTTRVTTAGGCSATRCYVMGLKENAEAAVKTFAYFNAVTRNLLKERRRKKIINGQHASDSYKKGVACGIWEKCKEHKAAIAQSSNDCREMIVLTGQLVAEAVNKFYGKAGIKNKSVQIRMKNRDAFLMGREDGKRVELGATPLESPE